MLIRYIILALGLSTSVVADIDYSLIGTQETFEMPKTLKNEIYQGSEICGSSMHEKINSPLNKRDDAYARFGEFPWIVTIYLNGEYLVAGTLLQRNFVLTTSELIENKPKDQLLLVAGDWDIANIFEEYPELNRTVDEIYLNNEIALIRTNLPWSIQPNIRSLCLPLSGDSFIWDTATTTTWIGSKIETDNLNGKHLTDKLYKNTYRIMPPIECLSQLPKKYRPKVIKENLTNISEVEYICGKIEKDNKSCILNAGAPIFYFDGHHNILAGISLKTENCFSKHSMAIFINIMHYLSWITNVLGLVQAE